MTAGGDSPLLPGVSEDVNHDPWPSYDPDDLPATPSAYVVKDARVGRYLDGSFEPAPGGGGTGPIDLRSPAVSLDATRLAAVSADGRTVYVGPLARDGRLEARITGGDLSQPSWDPGNNLWVVDRATGQIWYLAPGADHPREVIVAPLGAVGQRRSPCPSRGTGPGSRCGRHRTAGAVAAARRTPGGDRRHDA